MAGIPHRSVADDIYRDAFIPKNSTIITNAMQVLPENFDTI